MQPIEEKKAVLFDIQRFSVNDGPGIRTNLFFKGCPLHCLWCHNPESYSQEKQLSFIPAACTGCGSCVQVCPYGVNRFVKTADGLRLSVDYAKCRQCGRCMEVCCYDARHIIGRTLTVRELIAEVEVDREYYRIGREKGQEGGITLTGGEPMRQVDFLDVFLNELTDIHVCMETSGFAPTGSFERIMDKVNLFLFDYKATDPAKHRQFCGVDNGRILENLAFLCSANVDMILRLPLIPGVNDDDAHLQRIAEIIAENDNIRYGEIMPYHNLGEAKAEQIGLSRIPAAAKNVSAEQKEEWLEKIRSCGTQRIR